MKVNSPSPFRVIALWMVIGIFVPVMQGCDSGIHDSINRSHDGGVPNIIFIVSDALRADHLGVYGYERNTSPFLDFLGRKGVIFKDVKSHAAWTRPSMVSLFSGISPFSFDTKMQRIPEHIDFITDILQRRGYNTYGISANPLLLKNINFPKGMDRFEYIASLDGKEINRCLMEELRPQMKEPYFLWLHYMDTHVPYKPPPEWAHKINPDMKNLSMVQSNVEITKWDGETMQNAIDLYDAEILYWDSLIKELFDAFEPDSNILWVILSDHGEEFGDHGGQGHGVSLYEELLHIPLILYCEKIFTRPLVVEEPISAIDVLPTLLELLGLKSEPARWEGRDVLSSPSSDQDFISHANIYQNNRRISRTLRAIYKNDWKYIHDQTRGEHSLFNLAEDPMERVNRIKENKAIASDLAAELHQFVESRKNRYTWEKAAEPDPEIAERIKALGY
jgi:arylsulfatase A-like enzyme